MKTTTISALALFIAVTAPLAAHARADGRRGEWCG